MGYSPWGRRELDMTELQSMRVRIALLPTNSYYNSS